MRIILNNISLKATHKKLFLIVITIITALPLLLYSISQGMMDEIYESQKEVYGEFSDIFYHDLSDSSLSFDEADVSALLPGFQYDNYGVIYSVKQSEINNYSLFIGYMDNEAYELSRLEVIQGSMPIEETQIACTFSAIRAIDYAAQIGDIIEIDNEEYTLCGIVKDYGELWPKGEGQSSLRPANVFISETKAKEVFRVTERANIQVLLAGKAGYSNSVDSIDFYHNINARLDGSDVFQIPISFLIILIVSGFLIMYSIISLALPKIKQKYTVYNLLGMIRAKGYLMFSLEYGIVTAFGLLLGNLLGYIVSLIFMQIINNVLNISMSYGVPHISIQVNLLILTVAFFSTTFNYLKIFEKKADKISYRKKSINLLIYEFSNNIKIVLMFILISTASLALFLYGIIYNNFFVEQTSYIEVDGKMDHDFDISIFAPNRSLAFVQDPVYFEYSYEKLGAGQDIVNGLKEENGISEVRAYKQYTNLYLLMENYEYDPFLDASDFYEDGLFDSGVSDRVIKLFGLEAYEIVPTIAYGFSEGEIESFSDKYSPYIEGSINIEKIASGEEVILMAPSYTVTPDGDDSHVMRYVYPHSDPLAYESDYYQIGDKIKLASLVTKENISSGITETYMKENYEKIDIEVTIGAILHYRVGWFEETSFLPTAYSILTVNEAFDLIGLRTTYNRIHLYVEADADYDLIKSAINCYMSDLPYMTITDKSTEMLEYKRLNVIIQLFIIILLIIVGTCSIATIICQMMAKTKSNIKRYNLLRINGLSIKRLVYIWLMQNGCLIIMAAVLSFPVLLMVLDWSYGITYDRLFLYISPFTYMGIVAALFLAVTLAIVPSVYYVKKIDIHQGL